MNKITLLADQQIDSVCEYRYNQFVKKSDALFMHDHDYYELIFLSSNDQQHIVNGTEFYLPKHTLIFIRPNDCHDLYNPKNDNAIIHHIAFTKSLADSVFNFLTNNFPSKNLIMQQYPPYTILDSDEAKSLESLFNNLNLISFDDRATKNITMRSVLVQIFSKYFFTLQRNKSNDIPLWLVNTCNSMRNIDNLYGGIEKMVALSCKSKEHLSRSIKKYYNTTISDFINDIRLTYIANSLVNSDKSIIDICYETGFSNLSWMYTLFKRKYGKTPASFRK